jgi:hypothetical protein
MRLQTFAADPIVNTNCIIQMLSLCTFYLSPLYNAFLCLLIHFLGFVKCQVDFLGWWNLLDAKLA